MIPHPWFTKSNSQGRTQAMLDTLNASIDAERAELEIFTITVGDHKHHTALTAHGISFE